VTAVSSTRRQPGDEVWNAAVDRLAARALDLADRGDDAAKAAALLVEATERHSFDPISLIFGVRWQLAGRLDHDPGDLVAVVAVGLTTLASMDPLRRHAGSTPGGPSRPAEAPTRPRRSCR
jgi:hypothetical protein